MNFKTKKLCLIGIELGTTRVKIGAYSLKGEFICEEVSSYPLYYDKTTSKAESDPQDWWNSVISVFQEVIKKIDGVEIKAICVGSHGPSVVALDSSGNSLCNSILWMDRRAYKEVEFIAHKMGKTTNDLAWYVPRVLWIRNNNPELFSKIKYLIQPLDYICYKLTGTISASCSTKSILPWNSDIINAAEVDTSLFPDFTEMGNVIGNITEEVSLKVGCKKGIPVVSGTGGADFVEVYISEAILDGGIVCDRGGTSQGVNLCWPKILNDSRFYSSPHPLVKNLYHVSGLMSTTGKSLQWYKELYYGKKASYDRFFNSAKSAKPGSGKLIFLPYLMGERTPWWDNDARGVFFGLSLAHDQTHVARSILEGVGFGINHIIRLFKKNGAQPVELRACGGQARSPLWNQIKADITGLPVKITQKVDSATLGLAIIAGKGVGIYGDIVETAKDLVKIKRVFYPEKENMTLYSELQEVYENLYPSLKNNFKRLSDI